MTLKKFSPRDIFFYGMIVLVLVATVSTVQRLDAAERPVYSQIRLLFEQEKVRYFEVKDDILRLKLHENTPHSCAFKLENTCSIAQ